MKIGPMEIAIILIIVLMVFGVGKLPQVGAAIGKSIKAFKEGQSSEEEEEELGTKPRRRRKAARKVAATAEAEAAPAKTAPGAEEQG